MEMIEFKSVNKLYEKSFKENWDRPALSNYQGVTLHYRDVARRIAKMHIMYERCGLEKGDKVKLIKEPENEHDKEAIEVKVKALGRIGYVANSPWTVQGESISAGRLYDKIGKKAMAEVVYVLPQGAICRLTNKGRKEI